MIRALFILGCLFITISAEDACQRRVLALFDSSEASTGTADTSNIHRLLEAPLNHLGMVVDYADVTVLPLPDPRAYRAIVIWFGDDQMVRPDQYLHWLADAVSAGVRLVCLNGLGAVKDDRGEPVDPLLLAPVLEAWGLSRDLSLSALDNPMGVRCDDLNPEAFGFEISEPTNPGRYPGRLTPLLPTVQVWRSLRRSDRPESDSAMIAVGPHGGYCGDAMYAVQTVTDPAYLVRWDLNPYRFLSEALGLAGMPRPDVTTAFGLRAAFSSIDGDGLLNGTQDFSGTPRLAGAVIRDDVLAQIQFPITVSFIMGELELPGPHHDEALPLARSIAALPNVQIGSHGYTHPLDWVKGRLGIPVPGFQYDPVAEVVAGIEHTNRLVTPVDRRTEIFLWTGDCRPPVSAIEACAKLGVLEINGGDARFDDDYPSVSGVSPLSRWVNGVRQTYTGASNENLYTELWTENFGGFRKVIETFVHSGSPRRLLPVHVYYHWYTGERVAAVRSLNEVYAWCQQQPLCWITASDYVRRVHGFQAATCGRLDDGWWIEPAGCPTIRFDDEPRPLDWSRCRGVIGENQVGSMRYFELDAGQKHAEIHFATGASPSVPHVVSSTAPLRRVVSTNHEWRGWARCFAAGSLRLGGFSMGNNVTIRCATQTLARSADRDGTITIPLPSDAGIWHEVTCGF